MLKSIFSFLEWFLVYDKKWLKGDIIAGITVGIMLIPQGIAYAMIAGLPPIYGLYTAMIPQIVYAFFGTSRQLAVGPVAMDSLIVAAGVVALAEIGTQNFIEFAILLAFMMGVLQFLFGVFRLGFIVNFMSKAVISGFTSAAALIIGLNQLKHLLGVNINRNNQLHTLIIEAVEKISNVHFISFGIGLLSIIIILFLKKYYNKIPAALVVIIVGISLVKLFQLDTQGVSIIGKIPRGLPVFKIPSFNLEIMLKLAPVALTLSFIAFLEAISVAKAIEQKHDNYKVVPNKELIAIGLGNLIGSFFQTYPATGGFSRTAVSDQAGANTQMYSLVAAFVIGFTLMFLTPVFYYLPKTVLAAIIMVAVFGLIDLKTPKQLYNFSKIDLAILLITFLATATVGITEGILLGIIISLVKIKFSIFKPKVFIENIEETVVFTFQSAIHFANTNYLKDRIESEMKNCGTLILDFTTIKNVDSNGIFILTEVIENLKAKKKQVLIVDMNENVKKILKLSGLEQIIGEGNFFETKIKAINYINNKKLEL